MAVESPTDVLIALFFAEGISHENEEIRGSTKIEKLMFLLSKEGDFNKYLDNEDYKFVPHNFGPFSDKIYDDLEMLKDGGLIEVIMLEIPKYHAEEADKHISLDQADLIDNEIERVEIFKLTDKGIKVGKYVFENDFSHEEREKLIDIKKKFNSLPLHRLLKYVYEKYPTYTTKSTIKKEVLGKENG